MTREEVIAKTHLPDNGVTSRALKDLCKCGFVREYKYYGHSKKGQLYQLADYYFRICADAFLVSTFLITSVQMPSSSKMNVERMMPSDTLP